ncbi:hypothetical protein D9611_006119 [Ephemerocybe angulata]|uniref:Uncharacterized protein n=1 Tax=Ephemerocybe angulata TaxID=980116 RepID=A0A8H5CI56_9AGAR|nr:hypothetical protein D9611_006119 [Tulosesus angulatus]
MTPVQSRANRVPDASHGHSSHQSQLLNGTNPAGAFYADYTIFLADRLPIAASSQIQYMNTMPFTPGASQGQDWPAALDEQNQSPSNGSQASHSSQQSSNTSSNGSAWDGQPPVERIIPYDLENRVERDFDLSPGARLKLRGFVSLLNQVPGMNRVTAIPFYYSLASQFNLADTLAVQQAQMPALNDLCSLFERIDARLTASAFAVSEAQGDNITALTKSFVSEPSRYEFTSLLGTVMEGLEKQKTKYGLQEHFKSPIGVRALRSKVSKIVSSVIGGLKEDVEMKHLLRLAVMRRFVLDNPRFFPTGANPTTTNGQKRRRTNSESDGEG